MTIDLSSFPHHPCLSIRKATIADIPAVVALLSDDMLGQMREHPLGAEHPSYERAFQFINERDDYYLAVIEQKNTGTIIATMQLVILCAMGFQGATRLIIEGVRVSSTERGMGIGKWMMDWAKHYALTSGCAFIELTTHLDRIDAKRFYEKQGFKQVRAGMKWDPNHQKP
jgi:GNAT superfamily N-acetyltransferase